MLQYNLVRRSNDANITVFIDGEMLVADNHHPSFEQIVRECRNVDEGVAGASEDTVRGLIDASVAAGIKFQELSDRVVVRDGEVYVDQERIEDVFADKIVQFLSEDVEDWKPLVLFLEKVYSNVEADIRENLSRWLKAESFTLLPNGNILGYRGLKSNYTSVHAGPGIVNGTAVNGHLDNSVGNVVEIDVALVEHNARVGCASGLHVGTFEYASGWSQGALVSVEVDPRHVRSVPYDSADSKMRVSKYKVLEDVTEKYTGSVSNHEVENEFTSTEQRRNDEGVNTESVDYETGYDDGYREGYREGESDALGSSDDSYKEGYDDGYREGSDDVREEIRNSI